MNADAPVLNRISQRTIGCAMTVANTLGYGFRRRSTKTRWRAQCMNDLRATGLHLCLLLNFGRPRLEIKRLVWRSCGTVTASAPLHLRSLAFIRGSTFSIPRR
jgi:hypothetical protein